MAAREVKDSRRESSKKDYCTKGLKSEKASKQAYEILIEGIDRSKIKRIVIAEDTQIIGALGSTIIGFK